MILLLAINIFPLLWTIRLSFTNYKANRSNMPVAWVGVDHYVDILTDPDVWNSMHAHVLTLCVYALQRLRGEKADAVLGVAESASADYVGDLLLTPLQVRDVSLCSDALDIDGHSRFNG